MDECPTCGREDFKSERGMRIHHSSVHGEKLEPDKTTLTCGYCGGEYNVYPYRESESKFCSDSCRNQGRDIPNERTLTIACDWCGGEFERYKSKSARRKGDFCDHDCYGKWRAENIVGENHPQWKHGNREYGKGWHKKKRRRVRERDHYRCCACGMTQQEHIARFECALTVHHIRPARLFDDAEKRNAMENLITLCKQCHKKWEGIPLRPQTGV